MKKTDRFEIIGAIRFIKQFPGPAALYGDNKIG